MKIAIDINEANIPQRVGVNQVAYAIFNSLVEKLPITDQIIAFSKNRPLPDLPKPSTKLTYESFGPSKLWVITGLTKRLLFGKPKPDLVFSPSHYTPLFTTIPSVIYLMDLAYERYGTDFFTKYDINQLKRWTPLSVHKAKHILTISQFSKKEIISLYKVPENKVSVIYPGYDKESYHTKINPHRVDAVKEKFSIKGEYLLYVGTLQPRKNLVKLVEGFSRIKNKKIKLVIGGKKGWLYDQLFTRVTQLKLEDRVIFTGFVPTEDLPALIRGAKAYILPSLYEGFGMPPIEAQACGVPVIVSRTSSLPEVVGESGIYIENPLEVKSITTAIDNFFNLTETQLENCIELGKQNIKRFSWDDSAHQILEIFHRL